MCVRLTCGRWSRRGASAAAAGTVNPKSAMKASDIERAAELRSRQECMPGMIAAPA
jgi:hypothetical protein